MTRWLFIKLIVLGVFTIGLMKGFCNPMINSLYHSYHHLENTISKETEAPEKLIFPVRNLKIEDQLVLLQIWDQNRILIFSGKHLVKSGEISLIDPSNYLKAGIHYTYDVIDIETGAKVVTEIPIVYWPECIVPNGVKWELVSDSTVLLKWEDSEFENAKTYRLRYINNKDIIKGEYHYLELGPVNEAFFHVNFLSDIERVFIQKVCKFENEIELYSNWVEIEPIELFHTGRAVDCATIEYEFSVDTITDSSFKVRISGPFPGITQDGPWYRVNYRVEGTNDWNLIHVTNDTFCLVEYLQPSTKYEVVVNVSIGEDHFKPFEICEDAPDEQVITTLGDSEFEDVYCGAVNEFIEDTVSSPLNNLSINDFVIAYNLPVRITSLVNLGSGFYSGEGTLKVPFKSQYIKVAFTNIFVNTNYTITSGTIYGVDDAVKRNHLNTLLAQVPPGAFSCEPPTPNPYEFGEDGLNDFGFGSNGKYGRTPPYPGWKEGMPFDENYDPNGFGSDGIHVVTGTKYNEFGCSQAGVDSLGNPCDPSLGNVPYYWMYDTDNPTVEGSAFWNKEKNDNIRDAIKVAIELFREVNADSIEAIITRCDSIRMNMRSIVQNQELDSFFLFGNSLEYFETGLTKHFTSPPQKYSDNLGRNPEIMDLELEHYNLYYCDLYLQQFIELEIVIDSILALLDEPDPDTTTYQIFLDVIKPYIVSMDTATLIAKFGQPLNQAMIVDFIYPFVMGKIVFDFQQAQKGYGFIEDKYPVGDMPNDPVQNSFSKKDFQMKSNVGCSIADEVYDIDELTDILNGTKSNHLLEDDGTKILLEELHNSELNQLIDSYFLQGDPFVGQPLEIVRNIGSSSISIFLDSFQFHPTEGGKMDVIFLLEVQSGKRLIFKASDVSFHGGGLFGDVNLSLAGDFFFYPSKGMRLTFNSDSTYVRWGCEGFESLSVDVDLEFCREYVVPLDSQTMEVLSDGYVTANVRVILDKWTDFLASIDVGPFAITGREEYKFNLDTVWLDFSDVRNSPGLVYPGVYEHPLQNEPQWQGVYFKSLTVTIPDYMTSGPSPTIGLNNFIFDDLGISGELFASDLLTLGQGSASGWAMSIDSLSLIVLHNRFKDGYMDGLINVPIFKERNTTGAITPEDCFSYIARADSYGNLMFNVTLNSDLSIPLALADVELSSNTSLKVIHSPDGFNITARLHGVININSDYGGINLEVDSIAFENLVLSNTGKAVRQVGYWKFPEVQMSFDGFEINFKQMGIREPEEGKLELFVSSNMNLTLEKVDLKVDFDFGIQGILDTSGVHKKWQYDKFNFYSARVSGSAPGVDFIYGELIRFKDLPTYGDGWRGMVDVRFSKIQVEVQALGLFGRTADYKYGLVDAMVVFGTGIPIVPPLNLTGIGGGFWYNMTSTGHDSVSLSKPTIPTLDDLKGFDIGYNLSGINYVPKDDVYGLKLATAFTIANENAINGKAALSIEFTGDWGLESIRLEAAVFLMATPEVGGTPPPKSEAPDFSPFCGFVDILYNIDSNTLSANFDSYLDFGVIKGSGHNNQFSKVNIFISENEWYFWFSTPQSKDGLTLDVAGIGTLNITSYFCIGTTLPPAAQLSEELRDFFGNVSQFYTPDSKYATGAGFMHGAALIFDVNMKAWVLEFNIHLIAGYDMTVMKYNAHCYHTNDFPGFNGWYGSGQIYAYIAIEARFNVKILGIRKSGNIASLKLGALLRAQLPNPVWAKGNIAVEYDILGVLKGKHKATIEVGERCEFVDPEGGDFLYEFDIIDYVTPENNAQSISCAGSVEAHFLFPIGEKYEIETAGGSQIYNFKVRRSHILSTSTFDTHYSNIKWSNDKKTMMLSPKEIYRGDHEYKLILIVDAFLEGDNTPSFSDTLETKWRTMGRPDGIPSDNIRSSFPQKGQRFFMRNERESNRCFIQLWTGQFDLFDTYPKNAKNIVRLIDCVTNETLLEQALSYNCINPQINFEMDFSILEGGRKYKIQGVQTFKEEDPNDEDGEGGGPGSRGNYTNTGSRHLNQNHGFEVGPGGILIPTSVFSQCKPYESHLLLDKELLFFELPFATSSYLTMEDKLQDFSANLIAAYDLDSLRVTYSCNGFEGFDDYEIGTEVIQGFLQPSGLGTPAEWLDDFDFYINLRKGYANKVNFCVPHANYYSPELVLNVSNERKTEIVDIVKEGIYFDGSGSYNKGGDDELVGYYSNVRLVNDIPFILNKESTSIITHFKEFMDWTCYPAPDCCSGYQLNCENEYSFCSCPENYCVECIKELYFDCNSDLLQLWNRLLIESTPAKQPFRAVINSSTDVLINYNPKPNVNKTPIPITLTLNN